MRKIEVKVEVKRGMDEHGRAMTGTDRSGR
jgi:hypothetical protein